jgi:hypothetical protein
MAHQGWAEQPSKLTSRVGIHIQWGRLADLHAQHDHGMSRGLRTLLDIVVYNCKSALLG